MLKKSQTLGLLLAAAAGAAGISGCGTPVSTNPPDSAHRPETYPAHLAATIEDIDDSGIQRGHYFWMFIPLPAQNPDSQARGFPAQVQLPPRPYTTNRIEIEIRGEVVSPGKIRPLQGSTVLEAVCQAGGFTEWAMTTRLELEKPSGERLRLHRRSAVVGTHGRRGVYYECEPRWTLWTNSWSTSGTDHLLEHGDIIYVRRRM